MRTFVVNLSRVPSRLPLYVLDVIAQKVWTVDAEDDPRLEPLTHDKEFVCLYEVTLTRFSYDQESSQAVGCSGLQDSDDKAPDWVLANAPEITGFVPVKLIMMILANIGVAHPMRVCEWLRRGQPVFHSQ